MTEVPEHLLKRSQDRRAALGLGGDGGGGDGGSPPAATPAAGDAPAPGAGVAPAPTAGAAARPAAALPAELVHEERIPLDRYVQGAHTILFEVYEEKP